MYYKIEIKHKVIGDAKGTARTRKFYADNEVTMMRMLMEGIKSKAIVTVREISQAAYEKQTNIHY